MDAKPAIREMRPYRPKMSEEFVRKHLRAWAANGGTLRAYCEKHDLSYKRIIWWRSKLEGADHSAKGQTAFVAVDIKPTAPAPLASRAAGTLVEIRLRGGRAIRVRGGVDSSLLQQLVAALEAVPC